MRAKIIATIGPASMEKNILEQLVKAGIDVIRINTSYGDVNQYQTILKRKKQELRTTVGRWELGWDDEEISEAI